MTRKEAEQIRLKGYEYQLFLNDAQKAMAEFRKLDSFTDLEDSDGLMHPLLTVANDYDWGFNLPMDHVAAKEAYLLAVKHSSKYAWSCLGSLYVCDGNYAEAKKAFEQALSAGDVLANVSLGDLYKKGLGVEVDYEKALKYYRIAEQTDTYAARVAKRHLADMYFNGLGVAQDYNKAFEIYEQQYLADCKKREEKGEDYTPAIFVAVRYAYMLKNGYGCKADPERAMAILEKLPHKHIQNFLKEISEF